MIGLTAKGWSYLVTFAAGFAGGLGSGWALWHPAGPIVETAKPAVRQQDLSLVLARRPDTVVKIPHVIPAGTTPVREISVSVNPLNPVIVHDTLRIPGTDRLLVKIDTVQCPVVTVNLTEVEEKDHTHRIVASSPDGTVLAERSIDVPLAAARAPPRTLPWSAGVLYEASSKTYGAFVSRELGPFALLGAIAQPVSPKDQWTARVGVGLRF